MLQKKGYRTIIDEMRRTAWTVLLAIAVLCVYMASAAENDEGISPSQSQDGDAALNKRERMDRIKRQRDPRLMQKMNKPRTPEEMEVHRAERKRLLEEERRTRREEMARMRQEKHDRHRKLEEIRNAHEMREGHDFIPRRPGPF